MKSKMTRKLSCYFGGVARICISGSNAERFINLCQFQEIPLKDIERDGCRYHATLPAKDYFRLRPVIKKTGICPKITKRAGLPFFLKKNRKRKVLILCALLFVGMVYYLYGYRMGIGGTDRHSYENTYPGNPNALA